MKVFEPKEVAEIVNKLAEKDRWNIAEEYLTYITAKWETLPRGWTKESLKKFWKSLTGKAKHKFTECYKKIKDVEAIDDPAAFCASLKDVMLGTTYWRKGRKKKKKKSKKSKSKRARKRR